MDTQTIINMTVGLVLAGVGWFARQLWEAVKTLQKDVHDLEVQLPSHYVRREEFSEGIKEIKDICNQIFSKISSLEQRKADR